MNLEEITILRLESQRKFRKSIRFLNAMQFIYEKAVTKYNECKKEYNIIDLKYAELTKLTILPSKAKNKPFADKITRKRKTRKIMANLDSLSIEQLTSMLNKLENKEI
jgi:hypothetical protein